LAVNQDPRC